MKTIQHFFMTLLLTVGTFSNSFAQDNTKVGLPEGAMARLGKGGINLMRFSPDGTRLVVGTDVGVWVYDVPDGRETALFTGHTGQVNALAFSTDGKILASGGFNNPIIQLWELETGRKLLPLTLTEEYNAIAALAFAKDNTILMSLGLPRELVHWDVKTGRKLADTLRVDSHQIAAFSQDGNTFATGDKNGIIRVWNATTNRRWATFSEPFNQAEQLDIRALAFSPDGKILVSSSDDETVRLWDTEKRAKITTLSGHSETLVTAIAFSTDGKTFATGDANKIIKLWDASTGRERATLRGHASSINALTFAPDGPAPHGGCLVSGSADGTIRFWNADTAEELLTFTAGHTALVKAVAFSENDTTLASAAFNGTVEIWNLKTGAELRTFTKTESDLTAAVAFSPDATHFASRGGSGTVAFNSFGFGYHSIGPKEGNIQLWDLTTGEHIPGPWQDVGENVNAVTFSPDNKILVVSMPRQGIVGWNIETGLALFNFNAEEPFGRNLVFSPTGTLLATNGTHVQTQVWDVATQAEITPPDIQNASALAFSPGGIVLAHRHPRDGIVFWHVTPTEIKEHSRGVKNQRGFEKVLIFSPNGKILLNPKLEIWEPLIELWDMETGEDLGTLSGHTAPIETLVFSHEGKVLASGSADGTVLLWDWEKIIAKRVQGNNR